MATTAQSAIAVIGIDIGKNWFHVVGLDGRGAIVAHNAQVRED
jgi:transposase